LIRNNNANVFDVLQGLISRDDGTGKAKCRTQSQNHIVLRVKIGIFLSKISLFLIFEDIENMFELIIENCKI
jgi:hypothetical protein